MTPMRLVSSCRQGDTGLALLFWVTWEGKWPNSCPSFFPIRGWKPQHKLICSVLQMSLCSDLYTCSLCSSVSVRSYSLSGSRQWDQRACDLAVKVEGPASTLPLVQRCLEPGTYVLRDLQVWTKVKIVQFTRINGVYTVFYHSSTTHHRLLIKVTQMMLIVLPALYHWIHIVKPKCQTTASGSSTETLSSGED